MFSLCRRGSPLLIGVRSKYKLSTEQIPVLYRTCKLINPIRLFLRTKIVVTLGLEIRLIGLCTIKLPADAPNSFLAEDIIFLYY